jgi:hypothetical protein
MAPRVATNLLNEKLFIANNLLVKKPGLDDTEEIRQLIYVTTCLGESQFYTHSLCADVTKFTKF